MATTTNFGWETPDDTDLVKDGAAAIRTALGGVDTSFVDLKGGTTGQVLAKASNTDLDFVWSADAAGMTNPMTTTGDVIYSSSGSTPARLGIGSTGQVLTVSGGVPVWANGGAAFSGCSLFTFSTLSIPTATESYIDFDDENFDTDTFHSTSTNPSRITIPTGKGGKYQFNARLSYAGSSNNRIYLYLIKNAGTFIAESIQDMERGCTLDINQLVSAVAGDYFRLMAYQESGGNITLSSGNQGNNFSIAYLGA